MNRYTAPSVTFDSNVDFIEHDFPVYTMNTPKLCGWCGNGIYHFGPCPRVKKIEHYENGTVKSVEFFGE